MSHRNRVTPEDIITAAGGRVMEQLGKPWVQNGPVGQESTDSFTRNSQAWLRAQPSLYTQVSTDFPRWERVPVSFGARETRMALVLASSGGNELVFSSILSSTAVTSTGAPTWVAASTADSVSTAASLIRGETGWRFTNGGGSTGHGLYQDAGTFNSTWATLGAIVEEDNSTSFSLQMWDGGSSGAVVTGELTWNGQLTATLGPAGSTAFGARAYVEGLGIGPNGGRAYRVAISGVAQTGGGTRRCFLFPTGRAANTKRTYMHHAQLEERSAVLTPQVRSSTTAVARAGEEYTIPAVSAPGGALTIYQESLLYSAPGTAGEPSSTNTSTSAQFLAIARGWMSSGGGNYVGGGVYARDGQLIKAASTGEAYNAGDRVEQLVRISTTGRVTYQLAIRGGSVFEVESTGRLRPVSSLNIPSYTLGPEQKLLLSVLARGVHSIQDFRGLFR